MGREFEKRRELDNRYAPPPPKSKVRIPAAAYNPESSVNAASISENGKSSASHGATKSSKRRAKSVRKELVNNANDVADEARIDAFAPVAGSENSRSREVRQQPQRSGNQNHFSSVQPIAHTEQ